MPSGRCFDLHRIRRGHWIRCTRCTLQAEQFLPKGKTMKKTWVIYRWYMENIRKIYGWYMLFDDIQTKHEGHHTHFCVEKEGEHRSSVPTPLTFWPTHIFIVSASTLISGGHINCQRPYGHVTLMPASLYWFHHLESPYWCWMRIALSVSGVLQHGIGFPEFSGVCP